MDKVSYAPIMESYMTYATEADNVDNIDIEKQRGFIETCGRIIKTILSIIDNALLILKNAFNKALLTDKGFQKLLRQAEIDRKPLTGLQIITYNYNDEFLNAIYLKVRKFVNDRINEFDMSKINDDSLIISGDANKIITELNKEVISEESSSMQDLIAKMKEGFRGKKVNQTIMGTDLGKYMNMVGYYRGTKSNVETDMNALRARASGKMHQLDAFIKRNDKSDEEKKRAIKLLNNLQRCINCFSTVGKMYFELKVEEMLAARTILMRMYQL